MSHEAHARLQREAYDHFNRGEFDEAVEGVGDEAVVELYAVGLTFRGKSGFREMMAYHKRPFPDGRVEIISQLAGPEGITSECVYHATHGGPLPMPDGSELPPTGKPVQLRFCEVWRIEDDKVVSLHNYSDNVALLIQLGLMPAPAEV